MFWKAYWTHWMCFAIFLTCLVQSLIFFIQIFSGQKWTAASYHLIWNIFIHFQSNHVSHQRYSIQFLQIRIAETIAVSEHSFPFLRVYYSLLRKMDILEKYFPLYLWRVGWCGHHQLEFGQIYGEKFQRFIDSLVFYWRTSCFYWCQTPRIAAGACHGV